MILTNKTGFSRTFKPFPTNQRFFPIDPALLDHTARESSAGGLEYRGDDAQLGQSKRMELPARPLKSKLIFGVE